ncbi:hypothetical protein RvVAR031_16720 [Agrobacterium vitis]|nr:hypothetical protein RvVAR031_16720 [Agrobacterium vitis]
MLRQVIFTFPVKTNARKAQDGAAPSAFKERPAPLKRADDVAKLAVARKMQGKAVSTAVQGG